MPQINNVEHLRQWFRQCPYLSRQRRLRVDYMAEEPTEYGIYAVPSVIRYKENVLGESVPEDVQRVNYLFMSTENYGADEQQNIENAGFYQDVTNWIWEQNVVRNFPKMGEGTIMGIKPTLTAYAAEPGNDSARYQIQIEITYKRN